MTRGFGGIDHVRTWRNALCRFLAPMHEIGEADVRDAIELSKQSDLWAASVMVELYRFQLIDASDLFEAIVESASPGMNYDWNVSDSILEIVTSTDPHVGELGDSFVLLNELSNKIKSADGANSPHAMWVGVRVLERRPKIVNRLVASTSLKAVHAVSQRSYLRTQGDGVELLPDLRWAAAGLLTALQRSGAIDSQGALATEAHKSFEQDSLPEVRDEVADWVNLS